MSAWYVYTPCMCYSSNVAGVVHTLHTYRRGLLRCSFYSDGQCEGHVMRGRAICTDSRAFFLLYTRYETQILKKSFRGVEGDNS
jgi:hypothetical protein